MHTTALFILICLILFLVWGIYSVRNQPGKTKIYMALSIITLILIILVMGYYVKNMH